MSFNSRESSRSQGEPISLLLFRYGAPATARYAYTDAEQPVTFDGVTYQPLAGLNVGAIPSSGTLDKAAIEITVPQDSEIAQLYASYPPSYVVTLTIRAGHVGEAEFLMAWTGRVLSCTFDRNVVAKLQAEPASTSMRRPMLRRNWQYGCPHVLYGPQCGANKAAATISRVVQSVAGAQVTLGANWDSEARRPKYAGGLAEWTLPDNRIERRQILRLISDTVIALDVPATGLVTGMNISLSLGCNHYMGDCLGLHNNIANFGGQPWIPIKNPIGIRNSFY